MGRQTRLIRLVLLLTVPTHVLQQQVCQPEDHQGGKQDPTKKAKKVFFNKYQEGVNISLKFFFNVYNKLWKYHGYCPTLALTPQKKTYRSRGKNPSFRAFQMTRQHPRPNELATMAIRSQNSGLAISPDWAKWV